MLTARITIMPMETAGTDARLRAISPVCHHAVGAEFGFYGTGVSNGTKERPDGLGGSSG